MPDDSPTAIPLSYGRRAPLQHRKWFRRWASVIIVAVLSAAAIWHWHEPTWNDAQFLYWQHQCLTYSAPRDQVVTMFDTSDAMAAFSKKCPAYVLKDDCQPGSLVDGINFLRLQSRAWNGYSNFVDSSATSARSASGAPPWPKPTLGSTIAFTHERTGADGQKRLVIVDLSEIWYDYYGTFWYFSAYTFQTSNLPRQQKSIWAGGLAINLRHPLPPNRKVDPDVIYEWGAPLRSSTIYAGQVDAIDPSKFTIRYELDGVAGTIDGQLLPGDSVKLVVRDGPATEPQRSWIYDTPYASNGL